MQREYLHDAFFLELLETFLELLLPRDLLRAQHPEVLRRETRNAVELHWLAG